MSYVLRNNHQSLGKRGHSGHKNKASKRTRLSDTSDFTDSDQVSIIGIIRWHISKWQRSRTNENVGVLCSWYSEVVEHIFYNSNVSSCSVYNFPLISQVAMETELDRTNFAAAVQYAKARDDVVLKSKQVEVLKVCFVWFPTGYGCYQLLPFLFDHKLGRLLKLS